MKVQAWLGLLAGMVSLIRLAQADEIEVVSVCGDAVGHSWYFANAIFDDPGWSPDGVTGSFSLVRDSNGFNIISEDREQPFDARAEGAEVVHLNNAGLPEFISLLLVWDWAGTTEHYLFRLSPQGDGEVVWTKAFLSWVQGASVMRAECRGP